MDDPVERQLAAYNAYDLDEFLDCFADDVVVAGPDGANQLVGRAQMRTQYEEFFARRDFHAEIVGRLRAGAWVTDHERVTMSGRSIEVLVAYEVTDGHITRMIALR